MMHFDDEELEILEEFENGEMESIATPELIAELVAAAKATRLTNPSVDIYLAAADEERSSALPVK